MIDRITNQQGDVLLFAADSIPEESVEITEEYQDTLALGEVTGHAHRMMQSGTRYFRAPSGDVYMSVPKRIVLGHEKGGKIADHHPHIIEPGIRRVGRVQQFNCLTHEIEAVRD